jgi:hypothetical protein
MSDPMQSVTTGMEVWLEISGQRFELVGVETTHLSQGVSVAMAHLAVGYQASLNGGVGAQSIRFLAGTPAQIFGKFAGTVTDPVSGAVLLNAGQQTLFDGVYDDAGPGNLAQGQFTLWISLVSKLAQLNTGSLQYAKLLPNTYIDSTVPADFNGNGSVSGVFDTKLIGQDFLAAFKQVYLDIATNAVNLSSRTSLTEFVKIFGDSVNAPAIPIIKALKGSFTGPVTQNVIIAQSIRDYLNSLFTNDLRYQSFLQRLVEMGQEFKFRVMEHPLGLAVVPYSPFFASPAIVVEASTVQVMTWANQAPNNSLGVIFTYSGGSALQNGQVDNLLAGGFKRTAFTSPLGVVTSMPCPAWMVGMSPVAGDSTTRVPLPGIEVRKIVGDAYARETTYEYAYMGRTMQMVCPLRMDIGLLSAVQVNYPKLPGVDLGTAIYGSVQAVRMVIDATSQKAASIYELGYVRSQFQQDQEFAGYKHPLWDTPYLGTRFDHAPV